MANRNQEESQTTPKVSLPGLPDCGWRVGLDFEFREKCKPFQAPRLSQIPALVGLGFRYYIHVMKCKAKGRRPHMDFTNPVPHKPMYGCPIGGIGAGSIGRGYRGEFCRFQMVPGMYEYHTVQADAFIVCIRKAGQTVYQRVLTGARTSKALGKWQWGFPLNEATYQALYPRAWTVYNIPELSVRLVCRQVSPIIPGDYKDSSFPMTAFVWTVENNSEEEYDISITFTFKNGTGGKKDFLGGAWTEPFTANKDGAGVQIHQTFQNMPCTYAIAASKKPGVEVSQCVQFDPHGNGCEVWDILAETGHLCSTDKPSEKTCKGKDIGAAVCLQCTCAPGTSQDLEFSLVWDMPVIQFRAGEVQYGRRYTKYFGTQGDAAPVMSEYCLNNFKDWETKIEAWQSPVINCKEIPGWYKSLLYNELYYVSDGGTVWLNHVEGEDHVSNDVHPLIKEYGKFAYLEGHEYRMYNTYDVHFYASFALIMLWPKLQLSLQYDMGKAICSEDVEPMKFCMHGVKGQRKILNTTPHDIGDPEDEPWQRVNSYNIHPTEDWKDLNLKFVLQVYRDYHATADTDYLTHMYPIMKTIIEHSLRWDTDNDGLIENGGFADQTFDAWIVHGASAYCGGLWLCALRMFVESAKVLGHEEDVQLYTEKLNKAKEAYEVKLWNGEYYNYDCSTSGTHDSVMADQLAGNWYLKAAGITDDTLQGDKKSEMLSLHGPLIPKSEDNVQHIIKVFPGDKVKSALSTVFKNNVLGFAGGNIGAINGTRPDGKTDISSCQSEEFWTGVTYSVAAQMIQEGMLKDAFQTAWGNYNVCWEWLGFQFQSPEAYMATRHFRSLGYMRALAVWSMQWALEKYHPHLFKS